jgi:hypothetical protein
VNAEINGPRPMLFVRLRLFRGGPAEWVRDTIRAEQEALYEDLAKARERGLTEDSEEIQEIREKLIWSIDILRDVESSMIELAGPNRDPR